jgi:TRAP-type C4-dicarboxylate transport system substrate-binding protein
MSLPREVRRVINARADDAIRAIWQAVEDKDRAALVFACRELIDVVEDEQAAAKEWTA